ncbi:type II secretion system protein [bacterium]|nr:type II secretion system protein [bacterium]
MRKFIAFTLAETLIVIGVIGIVSALTLPNLNSSTGEKERIAKVKKIYQNLQDAFGRAEAVYGPVSEWFVSDGNNDKKQAFRTGERVTEFMKISKYCKQEKNKGCFSSSGLHDLGGGDTAAILDDDDTGYKVITADGTSVLFYLTVQGNDTKGSIAVDIDGPTKGSNAYGKDIFLFDWDNTEQKLGFIPVCRELNFASLVSDVYAGGKCTAEWIVRYDNADYLQFKDASGNCKNGNKVTESNPRCK